MAKKTKAMCYIFTFTMIIELLTLSFNFPVFAYGNETHETITQSVFVYTGMNNIFSESEQLNVERELMAACVFPDEQEIEFLWQPHFYRPETDCSELDRDNALTRMYSHFRNGVRFWREDNRIEAIKRLGCSLHYMQDMCCVVHLLGWSVNPYNVAVHRTYENKMDTVVWQYCSKLRTDFNFREGIDVRGMAIDYSRRVRDSYRGILTTVDLKELRLAHQACCELIYLFFKEVGIIL